MPVKPPPMTTTSAVIDPSQRGLGIDLSGLLEPPPGGSVTSLSAYREGPMGKTLVIAEKPSVARDIASALPGSFPQRRTRPTWSATTT